MFPKAYFCNELFAPRYFPKVGAGVAPVTTHHGGGSLPDDVSPFLKLERIIIYDDEDLLLLGMEFFDD